MEERLIEVQIGDFIGNAYVDKYGDMIVRISGSPFNMSILRHLLESKPEIKII